MTTHPLVTPTAPVVLGPNTLPSFYPGAGRIAEFRRDPAVPSTEPEDWIASTTVRTGMGRRGLSRLPDGTLLVDRFTADPHGWFGSDHVERHGHRAGLLIKLLDAGMRLPLHVHPDRAFARTHLDSRYGKTEAWLVLHADAGAGIHLGFARDVTAAELAEWVQEQHVDQLLAACKHIPVRTGDVLLCPAAVPHAIGEGVLVVELQEMTDLSIMLEWVGYPIDEGDVFLGLSSEVALSAVRRTAITGSALRELAGRVVRSRGVDAPGVTALLPPGADGFFGVQQVLPGGEGVVLDARFSVLVVNDGAGLLVPVDGAPLVVTVGQTVLIPHAAGPVTVRGDVSVLRCYPA